MYRQPIHSNTHTAAAMHFVAIPGGALPLQALPFESTTATAIIVTLTERNAKKCRLTVSEYLRQLAMNVEPKELPSDEIIESIMRLHKEVSLFEKYAQASTNESNIRFYKNIADRLSRIQTETLQLLTHSGSNSEVKSDGDD